MRLKSFHFDEKVNYGCNGSSFGVGQLDTGNDKDNCPFDLNSDPCLINIYLVY